MGRGRRFILAALLLLMVGCGRNPVRDAIRRLDGAPAKSKRAAMELRLMNTDPVPALIKTVSNERTKRRVRIHATEVLGELAKRQRDEKAFDTLIELLDADDAELCKAAVKGFLDTDCEKAVPALTRLRKRAEHETMRLADDALAATAKHMAGEVLKLWNSPGAAMAEYERAEKLGLGRGEMGYSKAKFLEARGRVEEAGRKFDELGMVRRWWIIGPFPNRQGMGFRRVYPPEEEVDLSATYVSGYGEARWYRMERNLPAGFLDFEHYFVEVDNVVGYALVFLVSEEDRTVEIRAGSDDTLTLFLNGEMIWAHEQYRGINFDDDVVDAHLKKGVNAMLCKVCEDWGAWHLMARVTGLGDTPLEGVTITLDPPENEIIDVSTSGP